MVFGSSDKILSFNNTMHFLLSEQKVRVKINGAQNEIIQLQKRRVVKSKEIKSGEKFIIVEKTFEEILPNEVKQKYANASWLSGKVFLVE